MARFGGAARRFDVTGSIRCGAKLANVVGAGVFSLSADVPAFVAAQRCHELTPFRDRVVRAGDRGARSVGACGDDIFECVPAFLVSTVGLLTDHAVTVLYPATTRSDFAGVWSYTTLLDSTVVLSIQWVDESALVQSEAAHDRGDCAATDLSAGLVEFERDSGRGPLLFPPPDLDLRDDFRWCGGRLPARGGRPVQ